MLDNGDTPYVAVPVRLLLSTGAELARTTTNSAGRYAFSGLAAGRYTIVVDVPAGLRALGAWASGSAAVELDARQMRVVADVLLSATTNTSATASLSSTAQPTTTPTPQATAQPAAPAVAQTRSPSYTGARSTRLALVGVAMLLLGLVAVTATRRRRTTHPRG
jgi:hypothetical protein